MKSCLLCFNIQKCMFCNTINPSSYYEFIGVYTICNWHFEGLSNNEAIILINRCREKNDQELISSLDGINLCK